MHRIHKTQKGEHMFISQMHSAHLYNTINLKLDTLEEYFRIVNSQGEVVDAAMAAVYKMEGRMEEIQENARGTIPQLFENLYPYLAELFLRVPLSTEEEELHPTAMAKTADIQARLRSLLQRGGKDTYDHYLTVGTGNLSRLLEDSLDLESVDLDDDNIPF